MRVIVYHSSWGCDSGCCGHTVEIEGGREEFEFTHPGSCGMPKEPRAFAEEFVRQIFGEKHVADLDWENCVICED